LFSQSVSESKKQRISDIVWLATPDVIIPFRDFYFMELIGVTAPHHQRKLRLKKSPSLR
jgi:hypothetical protein